MNFEKYNGKRVRINTNIIDEETNKYKTIEGMYEGYEQLGNNHYIIIDGESYPEMCILSLGLAPKILETKPKLIIEEYIPAEVIQVDPFDMINKELTELDLNDVECKVSPGWLSWFNYGWVGKVSAVALMFLLFAVGSVAINHFNNDNTSSVIPSGGTYTAPMTGHSCAMINGSLCCNGSVYNSRDGTADCKSSI